MVVNSQTHFLEILTLQETKNLRGSGQIHRCHPVVALYDTKPDDQVRVNSERMAKHINNHDQQWLQSLKNRLLDTTDFSNPASALGEIRAYGALIEAGFTVNPRPKVNNNVPDFEVSARDDQKVIVEVHTKQMDTFQDQEIKENRQELQERHDKAVEDAGENSIGKNIVTSSVHEVIPLGAPNPEKEGDSILTNAISRIARIKENENQVDQNLPFILWLDCQDKYTWGVSVDEAQLFPLWTENKDGIVGCGAFWHAFYGKKNGLLIETRFPEYRTANMLHEGRYRMISKNHNGPTRISAVVISLPTTTVLFENPSPNQSISSPCRITLLKLPWFKLEYSYGEFSHGLVSKIINIEHERIECLAKALLQSNPE